MTRRYRLSPTDCIEIYGINHRVLSQGEDGFILTSIEEESLHKGFSHEELKDLLNDPNVRIRPGFFSSQGAAVSTRTDIRYPFRPGAVLLSKPVTRPRRLSLETASEVLGVKSTRATFLLKRLRTHEKTAPLDRPGVTIAELNRLEVDLKGFISRKEAARILGCSYDQVGKLANAGFLSQALSGSKCTRFLKPNVEQFLTSINALPEYETREHLLSLDQIYSAIKATKEEILRCFLDGKLKAARRDSTQAGLAALLLNPTEVKSALDAPPMSDPTKEEVIALLRTNARTINYLSRSGMLRLYRSRHPESRDGLAPQISQFRPTAPKANYSGTQGNLAFGKD